MTAEEFRQWFAARYDTPVDEQERLGLEPELCTCRHGWHMVFRAERREGPYET